MTLLEQIKKELETMISNIYSLEIKELKFDVSFIDDINNKYGDISTNFAMILSKSLSKSPREISESIISQIDLEIKENKNLGKMIREINFSENRFINIFLKNEFLIEELNRVSDLNFIETKFTNKKVLVEHSSPNLFKPFHIGHLMNNIIGESIVRLMRASKADLRTMSFPSDISIGIAKAIFILKSKKDWDFKDKDIIKILGEAYTEGVKFYEENPDRQNEIIEIAKNLFEKNEETEDYKLFEKSKEINIDYFKKVMSILDTRFDHLIYESEAGKIGEELVKENLNNEEKNEIFEIGEGGAIVFDTNRKRNNESEKTIKSVFINSEGHPTYEAKDLGLLDLKYSYFPFDYNFFVTDNEQVSHFDVVLQAAKRLGKENLNKDWTKISDNSLHIPHGRLNLKGERMSSRLGNILTVEETLDIVNKRVEERLSGKSETMDDNQKERMIRNISLSALRIAILKSKPGLNIDFDFEQSLSFDGATGPYLLYTYARGNSILEKYEKVSSRFDLSQIGENNIFLIKKIIQFEVFAKKGIEELAPQIIVKYLFDLSSSFNTFYAKEKIISDDEQKTASNIYLLKRFLKVFKFTMNMIGIEEVERM